MFTFGTMPQRKNNGSIVPKDTEKQQVGRYIFTAKLKLK